MLLRGLLGVALGIVFVAMPLTATVSYALITLFFLAGWAILSGVLEIVAAIRLRDEIEGEWLLAANGLITLALGIGIIVLFTVNPVVSILSMGWAIGAYALLSGILLINLALRLRRLALDLRAQHRSARTHIGRWHGGSEQEGQQQGDHDPSSGWTTKRAPGAASSTWSESPCRCAIANASERPSP